MLKLGNKTAKTGNKTAKTNPEKAELFAENVKKNFSIESPSV